MAATAFLYGEGVEAVMGAEDLSAATIKCLLTTVAYTPDQDAHNFRDDITNEVSGTNYTAGGVALTGKSFAYDGATNRVKLDFDNPMFTNVTLASIRRAVYYISKGGGASADPLLCWQTFDGDQSVSAGNFEVTLNADGLLYGEVPIAA